MFTSQVPPPNAAVKTVRLLIHHNYAPSVETQPHIFFSVSRIFLQASSSAHHSLSAGFYSEEGGEIGHDCKDTFFNIADF